MGLFSKKELTLKVLEAYTRDVGRGVARIDGESMNALNVSSGDVIELIGKIRTVATCHLLYPSDEGKGIIRIDGLIGKNSGIAIDDTITIKKIKSSPAKKVVLAPIGIIPPLDERNLAQVLRNIAFMKGDIIAMDWPFTNSDHANIFFKVVGVLPKSDALVVTEMTEFHFVEVVSPHKIQYCAFCGGEYDETIEEHSWHKCDSCNAIQRITLGEDGIIERDDVN